MPESKNLNWVADYSTDSERTTDAETVTPSEPAANDADGWQQYRQWISKAPAPRSRRSGIDPALYTWKGYRTWSEQVKRNWDSDQADDID